MPKIALFDYESAEPQARAAYEDRLAKDGSVSNMKMTLLRSLPAFKALMEWYPLRDEVQKIIGRRGVAIFCHAVSTENKCLLCSTYFRREFVELGLDLESPEFSAEEDALEKFARLLVDDPNGLDDELLNELKTRYSEEGLVLLTAFGGLMIATNLINNALKVELDTQLLGYVNKNMK